MEVRAMEAEGTLLIQGTLMTPFRDVPREGTVTGSGSGARPLTFLSASSSEGGQAEEDVGASFLPRQSGQNSRHPSPSATGRIFRYSGIQTTGAQTKET